MKLHEIEITSQELRRVPEAERIFLVQMSHLLNVISVLHKMVYCSYKPSDDQVQQRAFVTQQMVFIRYLSGILYEGWKMLGLAFFGSQISKTYEPRLKQGAEHLRFLKTYFNGDNILARVRDKFAFHSDSDPLRNELNELPEDGKYHLYLSQEQGNSLNYLAEEIIGMATLRTVRDFVDSDDIADVHKQLYADIVRVSRAFLRFGGECVGLIIRDHLAPPDGFEERLVDIGELPSIDTIELPYFVSPPESVKKPD